MDVRLTHVAKQALWERCGKPVWVERGGFGGAVSPLISGDGRATHSFGTGDPQGSVLFSGKREGFALYFARLVRPIWGSKLTIVK